MYPPLFSLNLVDVPSTRTDPQEIQTQVDVPSTCTTKDVPSNVLRQRSQAVKPLILCEWGSKRILRRLGEGRHKRIQAVSPLFFWKREKRDIKRIQANEKMNNTSFQGLENQKTLESFWYKEEEVQRDSRLVKD
ncbi:hypothetical protein HKD37_06G016852 [Glycine soja]